MGLRATCYGDHKKKDSTGAWTVNQNTNQRAGVLHTESPGNTKKVNLV